MSSAFDNYFLAAQRLRLALRDDMDRVLRPPNPLRGLAYKHDVGTSQDKVDVLIYPCAISPAPTIEQVTLPDSARQTESYVQDLLTVPASLAGVPAISCPVRRREGASQLPVGVQIVGQWGHDNLVLDVADMLLNADKEQ